MSAKIDDYLAIKEHPDRYAITAKTSSGQPHEVFSIGKEEPEAEQTARRKWLMLSQMAISYARDVMGSRQLTFEGIT